MSSNYTNIMTNANSQTLLNRGLNVNIRDINNRITELFQRYSLILNKVNGTGGLFGDLQMREIQSSDGVSKAYQKGSIVVKDGVEELRFLIDHKENLADFIGASQVDIGQNIRNLGKVNEYLSKIRSLYEIGNPLDFTQIHISLRDDNVAGLDSKYDWTDYVLTQQWIDQLCDYATQDELQSSQYRDHRLEYLSDMLQDMMKEHETDYHLNLDAFNPEEYLDAGKDATYINAMDKLNSVGRLNHVFYDLCKPIGESKQKYIRVVVYANGQVEVSGVVGLSDCEHVEWEYGSKDYLRSLNTGNQKYEFRLDIPFNDGNSALYWKPDNPEEFIPPPDPDYDPELYEESEEEEEGENQQKHYRYFKVYEKERYLRWFGTDHIPALDVDSMTKMTICSLPMLDNDTYSENFTDNSTNVENADLAKANIDNSTSQSLLTLAKKSSMEVYDRYEKDDDGNEKYVGQYARFVVSGHQQTSNIAFRMVGRLKHEIQSMNHFAHTWELFNRVRQCVAKGIMFLNASALVNPSILEKWKTVNQYEKWIPDDWHEIEENMAKMLQSPTVVDLLRMRQMDIESMAIYVDAYWFTRMAFLKDKGLYNENLYEYIIGFDDTSADDETRKEMLKNIQLSKEMKQDVLVNPLRHLYWLDLDEEERKKREVYGTSFEDITVDELRESIQTYNNLIVRLPVDKYENQITSLHIFQDWKMFVDKSLEVLVNRGELYPLPDQHGEGTDGEDYVYTEYYVDSDHQIPLIDYSYCKDEEGNVIHDRWDFWGAEDFI